MTVFLLILKVIGIILLVLLALVALVVLLVLFVPVRYHVVGSYHNKLQLTVRVSWLLHIVIFGLDMLSGQNDIFLRIFGIRKNLTKADNIEDFEDTIQEEVEEGASDAEKDVEKAAEDFVQTSVEQEQQEHFDDSSPTQPEAIDLREKSHSDTHGKLGEKIKQLQKKISVFFERIKHALVNIHATIARIQRLLSDDGNQKAIHFLWQSFVRLLQRIMPKKLKLNLVYSTGSPDTTGEILGVLALFPIGYQNRWSITPDFNADSFYVDADFDVRGRVFLYQILGIAIAVLLDKNCKKLYNDIRSNP